MERGERGGEEREGKGRGCVLRTDVRRDAREYDLALVLCDYGGSEVGVVPCVYLAVAFYQWGVGVQVQDLLWQRAVGSGLGACGQDDGDVEGFCDGGVRDDVVAEDGRVVVADLDGGGVSLVGGLW